MKFSNWKPDWWLNYSKNIRKTCANANIFFCDIPRLSSKRHLCKTQSRICASCNLCITRAIQLDACFFFHFRSASLLQEGSKNANWLERGQTKDIQRRLKHLSKTLSREMRLSQSEKSPTDLRASPICSPPRADWKICKFLVFSAPGSQLKREMINSLCSHRFKKDKIPRFSLFTQVVFYWIKFLFAFSRFCLHFI